jgi:hypothetical protein
VLLSAQESKTLATYENMSAPFKLRMSKRPKKELENWYLVFIPGSVLDNARYV